MKSNHHQTTIVELSPLSGLFWYPKRKYFISVHLSYDAREPKYAVEPTLTFFRQEQESGTMNTFHDLRSLGPLR